MYQFFDITTDTGLLHASVRDNPELERVVESIQWEIIQAFSQRDMQGLTTYEAFFRYEFGVDPRDVIKVRLLGYDEENPEQSEAGLKEVLKRTIATIASWVLRNYDNNDGVKSIRQGQRSITYTGLSPSWRDFPAGWDRWLVNYDARIKNYGI